jgi:hypothetical protein
VSGERPDHLSAHAAALALPVIGGGNVAGNSPYAWQYSFLPASSGKYQKKQRNVILYL